MKIRFACTLLLAASVVLAVPISAATLYSDGPVNGTIAGYTIGGPYAVSNSFNIGGSSVITGFDAGIWAAEGDVPVQVDWAIGTTFFASDIASGTAILSSTLFCLSCGPLNMSDIYTSTATGLNVPVAGGTYYFSLFHAIDSTSAVFLWDENDGPSQAEQLQTGFGTHPIGSESFNIYGNAVTSTPEPGTVMMLGTGLLGMLRKVRLTSKA
jgi:hypothetical protein